MRVLHVYSGNLYGGVETLLVTLAQHRRLNPSMEPHFAVCFEGRLSGELAACGVPVYQLGAVRVSRPATVYRARRALGKLLSKGKFDVVVCHSVWSQAVFGPVVRAAEVPLAFWLHDVASGTHWLERWARLTRPDLAVANSHFTATTVARLYAGVPAEVIYCPVGPPQRRFTGTDRSVTRADLRTEEDAVVIVQVSRMEAYKGHHLHLRALHALRHVPGWVCWQVGGAQRPHEAQYLQELRYAASTLDIAERVRFLGQRSDVSRLLAAADIHCQPNIGPEPFGITFIEALYAGLPVVTTAIGGAMEIVTESCGLLVQPNDPRALADALEYLIRHGELRARLSRGAPVRARTLSDPMTQLNKLGELLRSVTQPAPAL